MPRINNQVHTNLPSHSLTISDITKVDSIRIPKQSVIAWQFPVYDGSSKFILGSFSRPSTGLLLLRISKPCHSKPYQEGIYVHVRVEEVGRHGLTFILLSKKKERKGRAFG